MVGIPKKKVRQYYLTAEINEDGRVNYKWKEEGTLECDETNIGNLEFLVLESKHKWKGKEKGWTDWTHRDGDPARTEFEPDLLEDVRGEGIYKNSFSKEYLARIRKIKRYKFIYFGGGKGSQEDKNKDVNVSVFDWEF